MEQETQDIVQERIKSLPKEVRDALASDELSAKIRAIGNNHHLHVDQIGVMEDEIVLTMIGLSETTELPNQLIEGLNISKTDADELVNDINKSIFEPIQDAMKKSGESKSVVMPSAISSTSVPPSVADAPHSIAPTSTPTTTAPITPPSVTTTTPLPTDMQINAPAHEAEVMFTEPTVSLAPQPAKVEFTATVTPSPIVTPSTTQTGANKPPSPAPIYKADPYREPIE